MGRDEETHKRQFNVPELVTTRVSALLGLKGFGKGAVVET